MDRLKGRLWPEHTCPSKVVIKDPADKSPLDPNGYTTLSFAPQEQVNSIVCFTGKHQIKSGMRDRVAWTGHLVLLQVVVDDVSPVIKGLTVAAFEPFAEPHGVHRLLGT